MNFRKLAVFLFVLISGDAFTQNPSPYEADFSAPQKVSGMTLIWNDEFNYTGKPDPRYWTYEKGFVRNNELQWYQPDNANCANGVLLIEGRNQRLPNPNYKENSNNWKLNRQFVEYTSASIKTQGLQEFAFGRLEIRARIDTAAGSWPAIWTLGTQGGWPLNGEVDIMEFYRVQEVPSILANLAWGVSDKGGPVWNTKIFPLSDFTSRDPSWPKKFHVWRMDWNRDSINLYLDDVLLNTGVLKQTLNPDKSNPFLQGHYLLLNLAIGSNGGAPRETAFPLKYEIDYVRYYK